MDKIIGILLTISAIVTIMLSFGDPTRVCRLNEKDYLNYWSNILLLFLFTISSIWDLNRHLF